MVYYLLLTNTNVPFYGIAQVLTYLFLVAFSLIFSCIFSIILENNKSKHLL